MTMEDNITAEKKRDQENTMEVLQAQVNAVNLDKDNPLHPTLLLASNALSNDFPIPEPPSTTLQTSATIDTNASSTEKTGANNVLIEPLDPKLIGENTLKPREQEREDEPVLEGLQHMFNNRFMSAKTLFEQKSNEDPLYALALSCMAFLKAVMTPAEQEQTMALNALNATYTIAKAQLDAAKKVSKVSGYFSGYYNFRRSEPPPNEHVSNGVLRAHVIKAECCLLIAVLQLLQESVMGYVKCGLNLRRAYSSYSYVWQKYKALGEEASAILDSDTVSGVQFGIGSVHLVLSALPAKILKAISAFGWKPDKELGFSLLNTCAAAKRARSPMATVMLLAYYSTATSFAPQILSDSYTKTAMETLLEAQRSHPNSALYLFFAGRISRLGLDLSLSTQSYLYAIEMTRKDWAEVAVANACCYEIALNHMMTCNWSQAAQTFEQLCAQKYWSAAFCKYMQGACLEMAKERTQAILAFAEVPGLVVKKLGGRMADIESYALRKVHTFQASGYQDLDFYAPALEFMALWNLLHYMSPAALQTCMDAVNDALGAVETREKEEYDLRSQELAPETPPPDHFDKRASLLFVKAAVQNAAGRFNENTVILNWVLDHKETYTVDTWVVPYTLWEAGIALWRTDQKDKGRHVWDLALEYSKYDFEYRLAVRLNLALSHAEELGYTKPLPPPKDDRKRFSISLPAIMGSSS